MLTARGVRLPSKQNVLRYDYIPLFTQACSGCQNTLVPAFIRDKRVNLLLAMDKLRLYPSLYITLLALPQLVMQSIRSSLESRIPTHPDAT